MCDACLAFACSVSLTEMRAVTAGLAQDSVFSRTSPTCASCRRQTSTIVWHADLADLSADGGVSGDGGVEKCTHCSGRIEPPDSARVVDADRFHDHCWRRLTSDATVPVSRDLGQRSRELIRQSRERTGKA